MYCLVRVCHAMLIILVSYEFMRSALCFLFQSLQKNLCTRVSSSIFFFVRTGPYCKITYSACNWNKIICYEKIVKAPETESEKFKKMMIRVNMWDIIAYLLDILSNSLKILFRRRCKIYAVSNTVLLTLKYEILHAV